MADPHADRFSHADRFALPMAEHLLGCLRGSSRSQVQSAYRRTLLRGRPDLGHADGEWTRQVQAARDLLMAWAPPERRRRRRDAPADDSWRPRRRSTWGAGRSPGAAVDVQL